MTLIDDANTQAALTQLISLHVFNKLHISDLEIISKVYEVDAKKLCEDNGITYNI